MEKWNVAHNFELHVWSHIYWQYAVETNHYEQILSVLKTFVLLAFFKKKKQYSFDFDEHNYANKKCFGLIKKKFYFIFVKKMTHKL